MVAYHSIEGMRRQQGMHQPSSGSLGFNIFMQIVESGDYSQGRTGGRNLCGSGTIGDFVKALLQDVTAIVQSSFRVLLSFVLFNCGWWVFDICKACCISCESDNKCGRN
jgi:hypothetical protein